MCWRTSSKHENDVGTWALEHMGTCLFSQEVTATKLHAGLYH